MTAAAPETELLVPMDLKALVVDDSEPGAQEGVDRQRPYERIASAHQVLGEQLEPGALFQTQPRLNAAGVHLHWALPDALTHGMAHADHGLQLPPIPDRWLVVRLWSTASLPAQVQHRAWVIESDRVVTLGGRSWPGPRLAVHEAPAGAAWAQRAGWQQPLAEWQEDPAAARIPVETRTAVGDGDLAFAASYPAGRGMLGFHDALEDLPAGELAYVVVGWYAGAAHDPLASLPNGLDRRDAIARQFEECRWTFPGIEAARQWEDLAHERLRLLNDADQLSAMLRRHHVSSGGSAGHRQKVGAVESRISADIVQARKCQLGMDQLGVGMPTAVVCHGLVAHVGWRGPAHAHGSGVPQPPRFRLGLGENAAEAYAALCRGHLDERRLDLLEAYLQDLLRDTGRPGVESARPLQRHERGFRPRPRGCRWALTPPATGQAGGRTVIPGELQEQLAVLNASQAVADRCGREADAVRRELYADWYRRTRRGAAADAGALDERSARQAEIAALAAEGARHADACERLAPVLRERIARFLPGHRLEVIEDERFWRPNDPVLALAGPALRRAWRHGGDGRFRNDGGLLCRRGNQTMQADGTPPCTLADGLWMGAGIRQLPAATRALVDEALLMAFGPVDPQAPADSNPAARWRGHAPAPVVAPEWGGNPWLPLLLQWEVSWQPLPAEALGGSGAWPWDAAGTQFLWDPACKPDQALRYRGVSWLAHDPGETLEQRLRQRLAATGVEGAEGEKAPPYEGYASTDTVCVPLDGLTDRLLCRHAHFEIPPLDLPATADGDLRPSTIAADVAPIDWIAPALDEQGGEATRMLPLRAGALRLERLWVVDAFGRVLRLGQGDGATALPPPAQLPRRRDSAGEALWLEPRLAQAARLVMDWPAAEEGRAGASPDPLCGWLVYNPLSQALMVYDARGRALGMLQAFGDDKSLGGAFAGMATGQRWLPAPGAEGPASGPGPGANVHLSAFVDRLLGLGTEDQDAWLGLLQKVDEALGSGGGRAAALPHLALLMGRPLALVRASLRLELDGRATTGPDGASGDVQKLSFPVQLGDRRRVGRTWLGDDGLLGYFVGGVDGPLHLAHGLLPGPGKFLVDGPPPRLSVQQPLELTLLLDPSAGVVVTSGILPRAHFHLPRADLGDALAHRQAMFFAGPVLSPPGTIRLPVPAATDGAWSWLQRGPRGWETQALAESPPEPERVPEGDLQLADGWLRLVTAPLHLQDFGIAGCSAVAAGPASGDLATFELADDAPALLTWSVVGAGALALHAGDGRGQQAPLFATDSLPLPTQFQLAARAAGLYTLVATALPDGSEGAGVAAGPPSRASLRLVIRRAGAAGAPAKET